MKINIKKFLGISLVFLFGFLILFISVIKTANSQIKSQNFQVEFFSEETPNLPSEKVDYYLPYPGILPDHFLYPLKMIRDRILVFLTTDPLKKSQLFLLYADKRLAAGKSLLEKGKVDLGITTITKAEKYLEKALIQEEAARKAGKNTQEFLEKLYLASQKHQEVITQLSEKTQSEEKKILESFLRYSQGVYKEVLKRLGK